ncbi:MAG: hypothetical protein C4520_12120 [Candidatus Abyssobacteria bacterium SURF_5]|uniref:DUF2029 domain-containing protein n=1 Tax=Abyssobacteria bacterium (strain SURF_5) TaxID=2093360 RepID=A0A3A4NGQ1_ABYX5|nr:MAG: hypothetical protein C4520_12120 [Candidatus Abyssubacteria bacterium SURF_5]
MILLYIAFGFAFRIMMAPANQLDPHVPDLTGDLMMNYDVVAEIIGARSIIDGSFSMYVGKYSADVVPPDGVALPYPPLMAYMQAPVVFIADRFGVEPFGMVMMMLCGLPYIVLGGLLAWQAGSVLQNTLGIDDELSATTVTLLVLFSALLFWVVTYAARFELVAPLFLILAMTALSRGRYGRAGFWNGMALMTKLTSLPATAVFAAIILKEMVKGEVSVKQAARFAAGTPIPLLILLPFLIAHPRALYEGLFVTPALLPIMDVSFVNLLVQAGAWIFDKEPLRELLKLHSSSMILAASFIFVAAVVWKKDVKPGTSRFCALIALASFFLPVLAKYTYIDKYTAVASIFVILWGASRRKGFPHEAVWFVILQSFLLDHVPVIWKRYVGLIFYAVVFAYVFYFAFVVRQVDDAEPAASGEQERRATESAGVGLQ